MLYRQLLLPTRFPIQNSLTDSILTNNYNKDVLAKNGKNKAIAQLEPFI